MAAIEITRPLNANGSLFARLVARIASWNDTRVTRNALSRLTDRELNDIGLERGDIRRVSVGL
ncbi:DUF1127 domain-containing protein [Roseovarius sp. SCSIO 43702]|uniref:DUF1127 domain-containing protein n=1 Tax=Roseovarius sp. SCSIO 43702 TaxID=2823043 RepID=UPI001C73051F|nr:DUF1127 domain-containing protein [Roseovarius sp. SCSIO 43702]QYX57435.1 DUF1127 domain-containing protein [Roseovarius sp. SCSIO 43702]